MYYSIEPEILLVNLLNSDKKECTIKDLLDIKERIERKISNVYVELNKQTLFAGIENYSNMFFWTGNSIKRVDNSENYFSDNYITTFFNRKIPDEIRVPLLECIHG
ncbi:MAG: hypothetical protein JXB88_02165 [Spirochaetales bacterium]|nr:hypothetical protein [Spirochaetales bacterium]